MTFSSIYRYNTISPAIQYSKRVSTINNVNPLNGLDIGIPLNIFSNIFTNLHYGYDITSVKSVLIQFLLGYYSYGKDRYSDALDYVENPYPSEKSDFYNFIYERKAFYNATLNIALFTFIYLLLNNDAEQYNNVINLPFVGLIYLCGEYKQYKPLLDIYKPLYIGIMWSIATIVLPCVLYEHNYNILLYPQDYLPCVLILFSASNYIDYKDIEEDKINNINTIPVKYGVKKSTIISFIALAISAILLVENPNFENRVIINSLIELQNFGLMALYYNTSFSQLS